MNEYEITLELLKLAAQEGAFKSSNKDELIQDIVKAFNDIKAEILKKQSQSLKQTLKRMTIMNRRQNFFCVH